MGMHDNVEQEDFDLNALDPKAKFEDMKNITGSSETGNEERTVRNEDVVQGTSEEKLGEDKEQASETSLNEAPDFSVDINPFTALSQSPDHMKNIKLSQEKEKLQAEVNALSKEFVTDSVEGQDNSGEANSSKT